MQGQRLFVIISLAIDIALLGFALFVINIQSRIGLFLTIFPLIIALITFFITKIVKKYEMIRALKYVSIAYFASYIIPLGIFIILQMYFAPRAIALYGVVQPEYGVRTDPIIEQCYRKCVELANESREFFKECVDRCRK
jgi:hypothetical protein